jgi:hypothetical protein
MSETRWAAISGWFVGHRVLCRDPQGIVGDRMVAP